MAWDKKKTLTKNNDNEVILPPVEARRDEARRDGTHSTTHSTWGKEMLCCLFLFLAVKLSSIVNRINVVLNLFFERDI